MTLHAWVGMGSGTQLEAARRTPAGPRVGPGHLNEPWQASADVRASAEGRTPRWDVTLNAWVGMGSGTQLEPSRR